MKPLAARRLRAAHARAILAMIAATAILGAWPVRRR
jgi:hypothetical protein